MHKTSKKMSLRHQTLVNFQILRLLLKLHHFECMHGLKKIIQTAKSLKQDLKEE